MSWLLMFDTQMTNIKPTSGPYVNGKLCFLNSDLISHCFHGDHLFSVSDLICRWFHSDKCFLLLQALYATAGVVLACGIVVTHYWWTKTVQYAGIYPYCWMADDYKHWIQPWGLAFPVLYTWIPFLLLVCLNSSKNKSQINYELW